jgi:rhodanese-related sulfurtransferase
MAMTESSSNCKISRWQLLKRQLNNLDSAEFAARIGQPNTILLDVRTPAEYAAGCLPGAIHLDYFGPDFWAQFDALDRQLTYLVYCRSSRRSTRVCTLMRNGGFSEVYNLEGGLATSLSTLVVSGSTTEG